VELTRNTHLSLALDFLLESVNALGWYSDYLYDYEQSGPSSDDKDVTFCSSFKIRLGETKATMHETYFWNPSLSVVTLCSSSDR
jgi:hypothetical protein